MTRVLVHEPTKALASCELTFIDRERIDFERAIAQHSEYVETFRNLGAEVSVLNVNASQPDAVFVEDVAVILDELAVITTMGSPNRRGEVPAMQKEIARYRETASISLPATIEGGDVLRVGKTIYVGESCRTNAQGIQAFRKIVSPLGYKVNAIKVLGCLHLKTCITALDPETFILNREWLDISSFKDHRLIDIDSSEPWSGNTLPLNGTLILNAAYPRTADKIESLGYKTARVDISEFVKAEAGLTCMSLIFQ